MNANLTKIAKNLREFAAVVNEFKSEEVQVKVADVFLDVFIGIDTKPMAGRLTQVRTAARDDHRPAGRRKAGATKVLSRVLNTDYFSVPRSIADVAAHCKEAYDADFKTSELSGILLKLAGDGKLIRTRSTENNRFEYISIIVKK